MQTAKGVSAMPNTENAIGKTGTRFVVSASMALSGALFFLAFVFEDVSALTNTTFSDLPWGLILRYAIAMGIGGAISGLVLAGLFGRKGLLGWLLALFGGVAAAVFAGIVGSFVGLVPELLTVGWQQGYAVAVASGALVLPLAWSGWPVLIPIWGVLVLSTHVLVRRKRIPH